MHSSSAYLLITIAMYYCNAQAERREHAQQLSASDRLHQGELERQREITQALCLLATLLS